jgi:Protein of unknown function (DUF2510)
VWVETSTPGWYADPTGRHDYRYWTGDRWSPRVADGGAGLLNPAEALAQATAGDDQLPDHVPPQPPPTSPRVADGRGRGVPGGHVPGTRSPAPPRDRRRRPVVLALLVVLVVVGGLAALFVALDPGEVEEPSGGSRDAGETADGGDAGDGGDTADDGGSDPVDPDQPDDEVTTAVFEYIVATSGGAVGGDAATCMAQRIVDSVGRDRLTEVGVADGADLLTSLERPEVEAGLPPAMECLDDEQVKGLISATLRPDVLQQLNAQSPECLVEGWFEGFGRDQLTRLYAVWAAPGTVELGSVLTPDELGVLGEVIGTCAAAPGP